MSLTRKIAHNTGVQILGKIISTALGLVALAMMTRYLGTEQFGWYVTAISFLQFVGILIDFGLIPVTAQMLGEGIIPEKKLIKNLLGFRFVSAVVFLGITPLVALFFPYNTEIKIAITFTTLNFLAVAMNQVLVGYYQKQLKMHIQAIGEVLGRVALVGGLWLVISGGYGFLPVMAMVTLGSVVYTLAMWFHLATSEHRAGFGFDLSIWKQIMSKSWPIAISIIFNVVYLKGDTLLLTLFASQTDVGLYGAAYRVIDILAQTAMMLMGVMLPLLAANWAKHKAEFSHRYQQSFDAMMLLAVPILVGLVVLAEPIMTLVAGPEFIGSAIILQILAVAVFGVYLGAVFGHTAVAINKQKQTMWIYISNAIITLIGYLYFIPKFGLYGAAGMTVFSELYAGVLLWIVIHNYTKYSLSLKLFGKIILASAFMGAAIYALQDYNVVAISFAGACVYGFMLYAWGGISKETLEDIMKLKS